MSRKTQIMHVPIEIYNKYGKEKLQEIIVNFDAAQNNSATPHSRTAKDAAIEQGIIEPPEKKTIIINPDLEVKQKESVEDGIGRNDNNNIDSCSSNEHRPTPQEAGTFTKEQTEFLQSQKFKQMMIHGVENGFRPQYLDACIIVLQEFHGLHVDREGLIEIMKDVAKSK